MLRYTVDLPPKPPIADLDIREVTLKLDNTTQTITCHPDDVTFQFDTDVNVHVNITLVDIDTSGNRSAPSAALDFVATDTIPPPAPGGMVVEKVEQIDTPPAAGDAPTEKKRTKA